MSKTVLFFAPLFNENTLELLDTVSRIPGVRTGLVSQDALWNLPAQLQSQLAGHWQVLDVLDGEELSEAGARLREELGHVDVLMAANEQIQVPVAYAREKLGIPGMGVQTVSNFRDKAQMKDRFREHGVPCARHCKATSEDDAWAFMCEVHFPVIIKPVDSAATQSTYRVESSRALREVLRAVPPSHERPLQIEEFVVGAEHTFETVTLHGQHLWHSISRYIPNPLDVVNNPWIQWRIVLPREVDAPEFDDIRAVGCRALDALGAHTCLTHMEWFRRGDGSIAIGECAARPPGPQLQALMNRAHDVDMNLLWARLMIFHEFTPPAERKYAAGVAFLRGMGGHRVKTVHNLDRVLEELGGLVTDLKRPQPGAYAGHLYEGQGWVIVRHPETSVVEAALERIVNTVRVEMFL